MQDKQLFAGDLFCGGGGLTVGLKKAGFVVVAAVESAHAAASTYQANHPEVKLFIQDIRYLTGKDLLRQSPTGEIDLLTGCPPCQGFTSLTAKYHRDDPRNMLINEMVRLIEEVHPKAIMMENVPGLAQRGSHLFNPAVSAIDKLGYQTCYKILQVADYGVPQFRRRLVLVGGRGFSISLPEPTHSEQGDILPRWRTVGDSISNFPPPLIFQDAKRKGAIPFSNWHIVRSLSEQNILRLMAAKPGAGWSEIPEKLRPPCHQGKYKGFSNVYGRMEWHKVAPTITGGCTTFSRGRYGHPSEERTISVREAATLQTFPQDYVFDTTEMDKVCNIVGNALPCDFAYHLAAQCHTHLMAEL
ncbi:MAG: DNA-cytosine methyltransferase [Candidatus Desulfovibrio kirbyi]|uniref:DNA (cytosine-5-)-methyltransferase n=1 Tax=Candidatus Desulfovibrio kirbyi TaxID=2696086 RepID=A0A6L2R6B9_9BACT|nr:MAG: DNA-cytosine methyltransferase [Candidatus Desulfovibrio kirbyi]